MTSNCQYANQESSLNFPKRQLTHLMGNHFSASIEMVNCYWPTFVSNSGVDVKGKNEYGSQFSITFVALIRYGKKTIRLELSVFDIKFILI